ncbi:MAG: acyl-CoA dehydrogenase family protein [Chloroflexi bacterium]|nr:acyl-CoA dehydrogenase family protein [Chloroflexota bacterium]
MAYQPIDLLDLDSQLTGEERQVRDAVRSFVEREALPVVNDNFRAGTFPMDLVPALAGLGIFGAPIEGYGCAGVGPIAHGLISRELERADSGFRSFSSVQSSLAMGAIHLHGSEEQRQRYLPEMAAGRILGAFGLTEADHGSDPASMETRAVAAGGGYEITGSKHWITNGGIADIMVVWAKLDDTVRGFIVDTKLPGFSAHEIDNKLSMRISVTSAVGLDGVVVPEECLLPGTKGIGSALECLNQARYGIIWGVTGAASDCLSQTLEYTKTRHQFGKPIASFQLVQAKLADMATALSQAQLLAFQIGRLKEAGKLHWSHISMAKYNNARVALDIARTCRELLGAAGITDDFSPLRHALNLETVTTYEGTQHMHQLVLGRHLTGLDAIS